MSGNAQSNSHVADHSANVDRKNNGIVTFPLGINSTSRAVAMDLRNSREVKIGLVNASVTPFGIGIGTGRPFYGGDFGGNGVWYVVATPDTLYSVDTTSGVLTLLGQITGIPVPTGSNTSGLTWDYSTSTMYMCNLSGGVASLYTLNLTTRVATPVGPIITGTIIDIAASNTGQLYGILFATTAGPSDSLISINKTTGAGTVVGALGVNVNFAHGLDFDPVTDSLFYPGYIGAGVNNLYRINTSTGLATLVGPLAAGEYDCFSVMGAPSGPPPSYQVPEILYYKFEDNPNSTTVINFASPGRGTATASLAATTPLAPGGQFDTCITGTSVANGGVTTGWNVDLANHSWTIGMWLEIPTSASGSALYLFGDAGIGFRCFHNGVAQPNNLMLRGTGVTDFTVSGIGPAATYVHLVYDSAAGVISAYKNGVLAGTSTQTLNLGAGTGFRAGGYSTSVTFTGKVDEFRVYSRALDTLEIQRTWNRTLPAPITGVKELSNEIPTGFELAQNYPNPFNPTTAIQFSLPTAADVTVRIYNVLGQEVTTLVSGMQGVGTFQTVWNGRNAAGARVASGMYFYSLVAKTADGKSTFTDIKKMLLLK